MKEKRLESLPSQNWHIRCASIVIMIICFNQAGCHFNKSPQNDLDKMRLSGKVRSIKQISFEATEQFGKIKAGNRTDDYLDPLANDRYTIFDLKGNRIETGSFNLEDTIISKTTYRYDSNGKVVEETFYDAEMRSSDIKQYVLNNDGNIIKEIRLGVINKLEASYEYDDIGNKVQEFHYNDDGTVAWSRKYKHDKSGNVIEDSWYNRGNLKWNYRHKFDEVGNRIESIKYNHDESILEKEISKFDSDGHKIEESFYKADGSIKWKNKLKYDSYGNKTELLIESENGSQTIRQFEYSIDDHGNWVRSVVFENDIPKFILEREIEYFQ
ncbi:MAG: hypothetical protein U0176_09965 [Bacteroidia bacterium]